MTVMENNSYDYLRRGGGLHGDNDNDEFHNTNKSKEGNDVPDNNTDETDDDEIKIKLIEGCKNGWIFLCFLFLFFLICFESPYNRTCARFLPFYCSNDHDEQEETREPRLEPLSTHHDQPKLALSTMEMAPVQELSSPLSRTPRRSRNNVPQVVDVPVPQTEPAAAAASESSRRRRRVYKEETNVGKKSITGGRRKPPRKTASKSIPYHQDKQKQEEEEAGSDKKKEPIKNKPLLVILFVFFFVRSWFFTNPRKRLRIEVAP